MSTADDHPSWHRPESWLGGRLGLYFAPADPRVWVPRRRTGLGWTLNFARPLSYAYLALLLLPAAAAIVAAVWAEHGR